MGDNIVRRVPVAKLARGPERRPTAEISEHQLHGLIRKHEAPHDDLEPELELVDVLAEGTPSAPIMLPITRAPRLAHTLRRGSRSGAATAIPRLWSADDGPDESTIAMPRREWPDRRLIALPPLERPPVLAAGPPAAHQVDPDTVRVAESFAASEAEPHTARAASARPRAEPDAVPAFDAGARSEIDPRADGGAKRPHLRHRWLARLVLPIATLAVLAAVSLLLRAIL